MNGNTVIAGGEPITGAGGVFVDNGATFTMYGGSVTGNSSPPPAWRAA
jgi:hypothetical protein